MASHSKSRFSNMYAILATLDKSDTPTPTPASAVPHAAAPAFKHLPPTQSRVATYRHQSEPRPVFRTAVHRSTLQARPKAQQVPNMSDFPQLIPTGSAPAIGCWANRQPVLDAVSLPDPSVAIKKARAEQAALLRQYANTIYMGEPSDTDDEPEPIARPSKQPRRRRYGDVEENYTVSSTVIIPANPSQALEQPEMNEVFDIYGSSKSAWDDDDWLPAPSTRSYIPDSWDEL